MPSAVQATNVRFAVDAEMIDQLNCSESPKGGEIEGDENEDVDAFARGCGFNTQQIQEIDQQIADEEKNEEISIANEPLSSVRAPSKLTYSEVLTSAQKNPVVHVKDLRRKAKQGVEEVERRKSERNARAENKRWWIEQLTG